jgi:hypothetical protein
VESMENQFMETENGGFGVWALLQCCGVTRNDVRILACYITYDAGEVQHSELDVLPLAYQVRHFRFDFRKYNNAALTVCSNNSVQCE